MIYRTAEYYASQAGPRHRLQQHENFTDWLLEGEEFQQILKERSRAHFAKPKEERPDFTIPESIGSYVLQSGDWTIGTNHHVRYPYLITNVTISGDEHWEYWSWLRGYVPKPGVQVHCFKAIRLDDYLKHNCKITDHENQYSWFSGYVPQDDHMTEIVNNWEGPIRIWKIPEPEEVTATRNGQLTLF